MMNTRAIGRPAPFATVARIIAQLKGDPRAIALILLVPPLLLTLLYYVFCDLPTPPGQPTSSTRPARSCWPCCRCS